MMSEQKSIIEPPACPVETTLTLIGDKWKVLILRDLLTGTKRFGELKKSVGNVSQKVLTAQLRAMEESGLLTRTVYAEVPPRVEYTLTELGQSLHPLCGIGERGIRLPFIKKRSCMITASVFFRSCFILQIPDCPLLVSSLITMSGYINFNPFFQADLSISCLQIRA